MFINSPCAIFLLCDLFAQVKYQRGKTRLRDYFKSRVLGDSFGGRAMAQEDEPD